MHQALAVVPHGGADAVGAGVAAADDDDVLALGGNEGAVLDAVQEAFGVGVEELHREMNALEVAAFDGQIARLGRAGAEDDGVEFAEQIVRRIILADFGVGAERDAFRGHLIDAALHQGLVQLHIRDAVHEQAADAVGSLKDGHRMAGAIELGGGAQAGRAGTDDGDLLAGAEMRRLRA